MATELHTLRDRQTSVEVLKEEKRAKFNIRYAFHLSPGCFTSDDPPDGYATGKNTLFNGGGRLSDMGYWCVFLLFRSSICLVS